MSSGDLGRGISEICTPISTVRLYAPERVPMWCRCGMIILLVWGSVAQKPRYKGHKNPTCIHAKVIYTKRMGMSSISYIRPASDNNVYVRGGGGDVGERGLREDGSFGEYELARYGKNFLRADEQTNSFASPDGAEKRVESSGEIPNETKGIGRDVEVSV